MLTMRSGCIVAFFGVTFLWAGVEITSAQPKFSVSTTPYINILGCPSVSSSSTLKQQYQGYLSCGGVIAKASEIHSLVEDTYNFLDVNNDGSLRESEIATALKKLNTYPSPSDDTKFFLCDVNSDGSITIQEYVRCSVLSYGDMIMRFDHDRDAELSRSETVALIKEFSKVIYRTMTVEQQRQVIDSLGKSRRETFSLRDIVKIDTKLFWKFLKQTLSRA